MRLCTWRHLDGKTYHQYVTAVNIHHSLCMYTTCFALQILLLSWRPDQYHVGEKHQLDIMPWEAFCTKLPNRPTKVQFEIRSPSDGFVVKFPNFWCLSKVPDWKNDPNFPDFPSWLCQCHWLQVTKFHQSWHRKRRHSSGYFPATGGHWIIKSLVNPLSHNTVPVVD